MKIRLYRLFAFCLLVLSTNAASNFKLDSSQGSMGQGLEWNLWSDSGYTFSGKTLSGNALEFWVKGARGYWWLQFDAADGLPLKVGSYPTATRFPFNRPAFSNPPTAGLNVACNGRGNNNLTGSFVVREIEYTNGEVTKATIDFIQYDETHLFWWNMGQLRFNSDYPIIANPKLDTFLSPSVTVLSPNGGETLTVGETYTIRWNTVGFNSSDKVQILLLDERRLSDPTCTGSCLRGFDQIVGEVPNNGSFTWSVSIPPLVATYGASTAPVYKLQLVARQYPPTEASNVASDWSNASFFIITQAPSGGGGDGVGSAIAAIARDLSLGSTGEDVRLLQKVLNQSPDTKVTETGLASPGQENSYFGPATEAALKKWQAKYGLEVNGVTGPQTRALLNSLLPRITGGSGGGPGPGVVVPQPPPVVVEEIPFVGHKQLLYILESEGNVRKAMWCIAFLENPAPVGFNRILWDTSRYQSYNDMATIFQNTDGTAVGFRLPMEFTGADPNSLLGLGAKLRFFWLSRP